MLLGRQCKDQFLRNYERHCLQDKNREYEYFETESCRIVVFLNQMKNAVESLGLGVHCKVERIAGNVMSTLIRFTGETLVLAERRLRTTGEHA